MVKSKTLEPKLGRQDWVKAGLAVLAESGVAGVRVEPLAKLMKVTKGSFYWHFKDRNDLLDAILEEWVQLDTIGIIELVDRMDATPKTKLLRLFELDIEDDGVTPGLADGRIENAIRAWATNDPKVAAVLANVDRQRLEYTQNLFMQIGFSPIEALARARLAYYSLIGELAIGNLADRAERLAETRLQHSILTAPISI
ncbi:MAG: TetR/AcrR family transcriptional regulator [Richelia sp. CSU_2_1]|nr:TetR/AcrR family transcriptional regulator [Richelia sp. CSU_2_1]